MGPKRRSWNCAGRPTGASFVLLVVAGVMAIGVARTWAQPLPPCKTPQVYLQMRALERQMGSEQAKVERTAAVLKESETRYDDCVERTRGQRDQAHACDSAYQAMRQDTFEHAEAEGQVKKTQARLNALNALPECPVEPVTPPPPPPPRPEPQPQPQPQPGGVIHPPGVTATHRETTCPRCQPIAAKLNQAADNYALAVNRHDPDQTVFRQQMSEYSNELDQCERQCAPGGNVPGITAPPGPRPGAR